MIQELGFVNGIENYSRYFDTRNPGDPPFSLLDYFPKDYLLIIDESHMTIPQLRGMYNGDNSRKRTLVDFGFRLKAALDNRPLKFTEFLPLSPRLIYVSATPSDWELQLAKKDLIESGILPSGLNDSDYTVEQLVRPTGIVDPIIEVRPADTQIQDIIKEVVTRAKAGERSLITTLTKKTAEDHPTAEAQEMTGNPRDGCSLSLGCKIKS